MWHKHWIPIQMPIDLSIHCFDMAHFMSVNGSWTFDCDILLFLISISLIIGNFVIRSAINPHFFTYQIGISNHFSIVWILMLCNLHTLNCIIIDLYFEHQWIFYFISLFTENIPMLVLLWREVQHWFIQCTKGTGQSEGKLKIWRKFLSHVFLFYFSYPTPAWVVWFFSL